VRFGRKARRITELEADVARLELAVRLVRVERDRARAVATLLADREPVQP
jgi:hypothetical protein